MWFNSIHIYRHFCLSFHAKIWQTAKLKVQRKKKKVYYCVALFGKKL